MTDKQDRRKLVQVTEIMLDLSLAELRAAELRRRVSLSGLAALNRDPASEGLPLAVQAMAEIGYQRWADQRRAEINLVLARQTADCIAAKDAAARAFGRADVMRKLSEKLGRRR